MRLINNKTLSNLSVNLRFYILVISFLISLFLLGFLRLQISSDQLYIIRLEQFYGFISFAYLYVALLISPLGKVVGKRNWMGNLVYARRAIGVSAAYFAVLHSTIAFFGQFGGFSNLALLPPHFKWAFVFGAIGLIVLLAMAATSIDKVISIMTLRRWQILHRLIYGVSFLIILHIWMIGTHATLIWVRLPLSVAVLILTGLEAIRIGKNLCSKYTALKDKTLLVMASVFILITGGMVLMTEIAGNYHRVHHESGAGQHAH